MHRGWIPRVPVKRSTNRSLGVIEEPCLALNILAVQRWRHHRGQFHSHRVISDGTYDVSPPITARPTTVNTGNDIAAELEPAAQLYLVIIAHL